MQSELGQAKSVKLTSMDELIQEFAIQFERMDKNNDRLRKLANRVEIDPPTTSDNEKQPQPTKFGDGLLYTINNLVNNFQSKNSSYEYILSRLEAFI